MLVPVIDFGANAEGAPVLRAMQAMPTATRPVMDSARYQRGTRSH